MTSCAIGDALGAGATVGVLRGVVARANLRGPAVSLVFTSVRLSVAPHRGSSVQRRGLGLRLKGFS